jgi:phosphate-selective porin
MKKLLTFLLLVPSVALAQTSEPTMPTAPVAPQKKGPSRVHLAYDGGADLKSEDDRFELKLNGKLQAREESFIPTNGATSNSRFLIARARLIFEGHVWDKTIGFKVEYSFSDKGATFLKDYYVNKSFGGGQLQVRLGQFKRPLNRQDILSDFATEMPEKAETVAFADGARDLGLMLHNGYDKSPNGLEWALGVFNGTVSENPSQTATSTSTTTCDNMTPPNCTTTTTTTVSQPTNVPTNFNPTGLARVGFNFGGIKGYSEADLEGGPARFAVAASFREDFANHASSNIKHELGVDAIFKAFGFDLSGAFFWIKPPDKGGATQKAQTGYYAQAGYFVTPKHLQVTARFASVPATNTDGNELEGRGGLNYYFFSHNWKVSTDYGVVTDTGTMLAGKTPTKQFQVRVQAQLVF